MTQEQTLAILKSGKNVFLTGSAGTGKTYVLNQYIQYLKERKVPVAITASTGIAATHINGMTIHAWSGIGVKNSLNSSQLKNLKTKKYLTKKFEQVEVLLIDEISMLHRNQLEMVDQVLKYFKMNELPFGGIQVIFCGDFFQLPPIGIGSSKEKFAFMANAWLNASPTICYLTEQHRQSDNKLNTILNELRAGRLSEMQLLNLRDAQNNSHEEEIEPTKLYTHNVDVDSINLKELNKLTTKPKSFVAETKGNEKLVETLKKSVLAAEKLELKLGAKVMFVRNNPEKGIVNGSLGEVIDFDEDNIPLVRLLDDRIVTAEPEDWKIQDESGKMLAQFNQVPLRLAWAITIHKSQGMTLDAAEIDLSKTFEKGQGYVALSRLKKLEHLKLLGFNETALQLDPLAFKADRRFQELSKEASKKFLPENLAKEAKSFIEKCGGIINEKELKKQREKIKSKKSGKSTYDITLDFLKKNISIDKIAKERGMVEGTIAGHFLKIKQENPELNLSFYKPKSIIIKKVEAEYKKLTKGDAVNLKTIYSNLSGKISYTDIKLALAFVA